MELTQAQIRYLLGIRALTAEHPPGMATLAKHLGVSKPSVHNMLFQLEGKGVVLRDEKKRIRFTEMGERMVETLSERRASIERHLAAGFPLDGETAARCALAVLCEMMSVAQ